VAPLASLALELSDGRRLLTLPRGCDGMLAPRSVVLPSILNGDGNLGIGCMDRSHSACSVCKIVEKVIECDEFFGNEESGGYEA
jgi:hypothetical protein